MSPSISKQRLLFTKNKTKRQLVLDCLLWTLVVLQFFDLISTYIGIEHHNGQEHNPLINMLAGYIGIYLAIAVSKSICTLIFYLAWKDASEKENHLMAALFMVFIALIYIVVVTDNLHFWKFLF